MKIFSTNNDIFVGLDQFNVNLNQDYNYQLRPNC